MGAECVSDGKLVEGTNCWPYTQQIEPTEL